MIIKKKERIIKMLIFLFFSTSSAYNLDLTIVCACNDFRLQSDCVAQPGCFWESLKKQCRKQVCADYQQADCLITNKCKFSSQGCVDIQCEDYQDQYECDTTPVYLGCSWSTSCLSFTKCSDYQIDEISATNNCTLKSSGTHRCELSEDGKTCADLKIKTRFCSDFKTAAECTESYQGACLWTGEERCRVYLDCNDADFTEAECVSNPSCIYGIDRRCVTFLCEDITKESECTYIPQFNLKSGTLCQWQNSTCTAATQTKFLTESTCRAYTGKTYVWTGTSCVQCVGSYAASLLVTLLALIQI